MQSPIRRIAVHGNVVRPEIREAGEVLSRRHRLEVPTIECHAAISNARSFTLTQVDTQLLTAKELWFAFEYHSSVFWSFGKSEAGGTANVSSLPDGHLSFKFLQCKGLVLTNRINRSMRVPMMQIGKMGVAVRYRQVLVLVRMDK